MGEVEADETYIGGKNHNRHATRKRRHRAGGIASGKMTVIGAISRKGNVVCQMIETERRHLEHVRRTDRRRQGHADGDRL